MDTCPVNLLTNAEKIWDLWNSSVSFKVIEELIFNSQKCPNSSSNCFSHQGSEWQKFHLICEVCWIFLESKSENTK